MVYKNLFNIPNAKGNIFIAAFTTAHARLHLYGALEKLAHRVIYMDTDSVVFAHMPGQWKPELNNFLGGWTNEIPNGQEIVNFTTCGPKNYSYTTFDKKTNMKKTVLKVKGLRLSMKALDLIDEKTMLEQVNIFSSLKRKNTESIGNNSNKRPCMVQHHKKVKYASTTRANTLFVQQGVQACFAQEAEELPHQGPCNCACCSSKTSVTIPQVQFRKHRREGIVETADIQKEYRLVLNKRWLLREFRGTRLPFKYVTLPFGYGAKVG